MDEKFRKGTKRRTTRWEKWKSQDDREEKEGVGEERECVWEVLEGLGNEKNG